MKAIRILFLLIAVSFPFVVLSPAFAHAELRLSDPSAGAILDASPTEIRIWFSSPLRAGSAIGILNEDFQLVSQNIATMDPKDETLMRLPLLPLAAGHYTVNWKAIAPDGDITNGSFSFIVREPRVSALVIVPVMLGLILVIAISVLLVRHRKKPANPIP